MYKNLYCWAFQHNRGKLYLEEGFSLGSLFLFGVLLDFAFFVHVVLFIQGFLVNPLIRAKSHPSCIYLLCLQSLLFAI